MRANKTKAFLSVVATLVSAALAIIYWLAPVGPDSHPLHILLIDCIPDSIVVLLAIPIVYWLFYRRGLTNMGDCPLFAGHDEIALTRRTSPRNTIAGQLKTPAPAPHASRTDEYDILLALDPQRQCLPVADPKAGELIEQLNAALHVAESGKMLVVFTRHCHPPGQCSADPAKRCVMKTDNNELPPEIHIPTGSVLFECGADPDDHATSALHNPALDLLISNPRVRTVYVAGIALEHCVRATCLDLLERGKNTVALENAIAPASTDPAGTEKTWKELLGRGITRTKQLTALTAP